MSRNDNRQQDQLPGGSGMWGPLSPDPDDDGKTDDRGEEVTTSPISHGNSDMIRWLEWYRDKGPLNPAHKPILNQIIEDYEKCGFLYKETRHVLDLIEHATRWLVVSFACVVVLYCFVIIGAQDQDPVYESPYLYFTMVGICVIGLIICITNASREFQVYQDIRKQKVETKEERVKRRQHKSEALKATFKWILVCVYVLTVTLSCVATQFVERPLAMTYPWVYVGIVALLIGQAFMGLYVLLRHIYAYKYEFLTVDFSLVVVDPPFYKWLFLMGGGGRWPTLHYSHIGRRPKTLLEAWIATRSQTSTIEMPGAKDTYPLHDRQHTKDVDRLEIALEVSRAYSSQGRGHPNTTALYG